MKFLSSAAAVTCLQVLSVILAIIGAFYFQFTLLSLMILFIFYFLYSGIGVSMMMHRYWTHRSFEFNNIFVKWICTWFALMSCRGDIMGWVYIHRMHHRYTDTDKDPHSPYFKKWRIFVPYFLKYDEKINKFIIKDLINSTQIHIHRYYMIYIFLWAVFLGSINLWLLYFAWILPVAITQVVVSSFLYFGHTSGYNTFDMNNNSKNNWLFSLLFWGEGWHNNHHAKPQNFTFRNKWWEYDFMASVIRIVKK